MEKLETQLIIVKKLEQELWNLQDDLNSYDNVENPTDSEEQYIYELLIDIEELEERIYHINEECNKLKKENFNKENPIVEKTIDDYRFEIEELLVNSQNRLIQIDENYMDCDKYQNEEEWIRDYEFVNGRIYSYQKVLEILN